jgi:methylphosphotriester-DNA--protein-cysteine methyltransferase
MNALSEVLQAVKLTGAVFLDAEFRAPWCIDEIGYESEAAFNRAFKREFGLPPARWRRNDGAAAPLPPR